jgi:uncharacterized surface protein with fasciclin (FAS1) repeats
MRSVCLSAENLANFHAIRQLCAPSCLQHHAAVPVLQQKDLHDGESLAMSDGTKVTFHVKGGKVMVGDANIIASVPAANGVIHVIDAVLLPAAK